MHRSSPLPSRPPHSPLTRVSAVVHAWQSWGGWENTTRVEIYRDAPGSLALVMLIEGAFNSGTSVTNGAEYLIPSLQPLLAEVAPDAQVLYLSVDADDGPSYRGEERPAYAWVDVGGDLNAQRATFGYVPHALVAAWAGQSEWRVHRDRTTRPGGA